MRISVLSIPNGISLASLKNSKHALGFMQLYFRNIRLVVHSTSKIEYGTVQTDSMDTNGAYVETLS